MVRIIIGAILVLLALVGLFRVLFLPARSNANASDTLGAIFLFIIIGMLFLYFGYRGRREKIAVHKLAKHIDEYLKEPIMDISGETPHIIGKIIPINRTANFDAAKSICKTKSINESIYWELPKELRPIRHSEVRTIALLDWEKHVIGTYDNGYPAEYGICRVTIIDRINNIKLDYQTFQCDPPESIEVETTGSLFFHSSISTTPDWSMTLPARISQYLINISKR